MQKFTHTHTHTSPVSLETTSNQCHCPTSASALLIRGPGAQDGVGAVAQHQLRGVSEELLRQIRAVACQQLPGHEGEGCLHILSLLS